MQVLRLIEVAYRALYFTERNFLFQAIELINNELPADYTETTVTIVITDEDDQLPMFNQDLFHANVSENIGNYSEV